jgi:hypothetical protein
MSFINGMNMKREGDIMTLTRRYQRWAGRQRAA